MPSNSIVHVIGTAALIGVMVIAILYSFSLELYVYTNNSRVILKYIADSIATDIAKMIMRGENMTALQLNFPLESYSRTGYNVYIGTGGELAKIFPAIRDVLNTDPRAVGYIFVVASLPSGDVYEYALAVNTTLLKRFSSIGVATGSFFKDFSETGYPYTEAYQEDGILWLCRARLRIDELSNTDLSNYAVRINFNPNNLSCTWKGLTFKPTMDDVRFADEYKNPLDYYIDPSEWSQYNATVWVRVNRIPASGSTYIYMYWGTLSPTLVKYQGDPSKVFSHFTNFTTEGSLDQWVREKGNGTSTCNVIQNTTGLYVTAIYNKKVDHWADSYCNLVLYSKEFIVLDTSQGVIVESLGGPRSVSDQDFRIGLYDKSSRSTPLYVFVQPPVINSVEDLNNFTIIWGNASIVNIYPDNVLLLKNNEALTLGGSTFYAGLVGTNNTAFSNFPPGHEIGQLLVRIKPLSDAGDTIYGVLLTPQHITEHSPAPWRQGDKGVGIGFKISVNEEYWNITPCGYPSSSSFTLNDNPPSNPDNWVCYTRLSKSVQRTSEIGWIYLILNITAPGNALHGLYYTLYYNTSTPIVQGERFDLTGLGGLKINEVGFITASTIENRDAYFDMLLSGTYSKDSPLPDYRYINITGLPPGMYVELSELYGNETIFSEGNFTSSEGWAVIDILQRPVLGVLGPVVISIYDDEFNMIYQVVYDPRSNNNQYLSGGMIVGLYLGLNKISLYKGVEIRASAYVNSSSIKTQNWTLLVSPSPGSGTIWNYSWNILNLAYNSSFNNYVALGLFNNTIYSFIGSNTSNTFRVFNTTGTWAALIGVADGFNPKSDRESTTAYYAWLRVRPFVNPEPSAKIMNVENMKEERPPSITYDLKPVVVFSSSYAVDISTIIIDEKGEYRALIVVIYRGVRGP